MNSDNSKSGERCFRKVAATSDIRPGTGKTVVVDQEEIAVFNFNGGFYAMSDICPHRGAPLAEGFLDAGKVFCSWHCFDFNLKTGECTVVPSLSVQIYEVKVEGDEVFVLC